MHLGPFFPILRHQGVDIGLRRRNSSRDYCRWASDNPKIKMQKILMGLALAFVLLFHVCDVCVFGSAFALPAIPIPAMIQGYHAYSLPRLHNWSAGHFSTFRFVLCVFWLVLPVCSVLWFVLFFGFCYVTEL
jgi:hypothetical protein